MAEQAARLAVEDADSISGIHSLNARFEKMYNRMAPYSELLSGERHERKVFSLLKQRGKSHRFRNVHAIAHAVLDRVRASISRYKSVYGAYIHEQLYVRSL